MSSQKEPQSSPDSAWYAPSWLAAIIVATAALVAYAPVLSNPFVNHDERWLFSAGAAIREGAFGKMLVPQPDVAGYMPVGYLILTTVYHAGGGQLYPYHLVSLLLHVANAALLFFLLLQLTRSAGWESKELEVGRRFSCVMAAVFFAVHPIHAEAIAVASSLSDLAAAFFALVATLCYVRAARGDAPRQLGVSLIFAALSGLTRWTGAVLPAILLILDAYPLKRLGRRAIIEKIPYVLISIAVVSANIYAKMSLSGFDGTYRTAFQPGGMAAGVVFYVWKWLVPGEFKLYYVLDKPSELMGLTVWGCVAVLSVVVAALIWARRRAPAGLAALGVHVVAIAPVLVTTVNGWVQAHNRYAYLSGMALAGVGASGLLQAWKWRQRQRASLALVPFAVVATACICFGAQAQGLAAEWHDKSRQSAATLSTDPDAFFAHNTLGEAMLRRKAYGSAVLQFKQRLYAHPDDEHARRRIAEFEPLLAAIALNDEGIVLARAGDVDAAISHFQRAIAVKPDFVVPYNNLVSVLRWLGRNAEARSYAQQARELETRAPRRNSARATP